jgi:hypothetical protein
LLHFHAKGYFVSELRPAGPESSKRTRQVLPRLTVKSFFRSPAQGNQVAEHHPISENCRTELLAGGLFSNQQIAGTLKTLFSGPVKEDDPELINNQENGAAKPCSRLGKS